MPSWQCGQQQWVKVASFFLGNLVNEAGGFYSIFKVKRGCNAMFAELGKLDKWNNLIWELKELYKVLYISFSLTQNT